MGIEKYRPSIRLTIQLPEDIIQESNVYESRNIFDAKITVFHVFISWTEQIGFAHILSNQIELGWHIFFFKLEPRIEEVYIMLRYPTNIRDDWVTLNTRIEIMYHKL